LDAPVTLTISPEGLDQKLTVEVDTVCECDCERPGNAGFEAQAESCSSRGDNECGACNCFDGFSGDDCSCDEATLGGADGEEKCRDPENGSLCNGLGSCVCGACICNDPQRRYGAFCQVTL